MCRCCVFAFICIWESVNWISFQRSHVWYQKKKSPKLPKTKVVFNVLVIETEVHILWYRALFLKASTNLQNIWFYLTPERKCSKGNNTNAMHFFPNSTVSTTASLRTSTMSDPLREHFTECYLDPRNPLPKQKWHRMKF